MKHRRCKTLAVLLGILLLPGALSALGLDQSRHLLLRTGFDASPSQIRLLSRMSKNEAVTFIVDRAARDVTRLAVAPPTWARRRPDVLPWPVLRGLPPQKAEALRLDRQKELARRALQLKEWYIEEIIHSPDPFAEKMVLFWHNNFTSSLEKVGDPGLLFNQDQTIRRYAFGSFAQMLHAVARDPAMIIYLDNETNTRGAANENFAREVMELFTMGLGHYTEQDVKQSARAFTGWRVNFRTGSFLFAPRLHDYGRKTFLGESGDWNGNDILNIILAQKATSLFITTKLWKALVSPDPNPAEVASLAARFRATGYQIRPLLVGLLETPEFWSSGDAGMLVKSPVDLLAGTVRELGIESFNPRTLVAFSYALGQDLFNPRTVKGWPTGNEWIDSQTVILRRQFLGALLGYYARELRARAATSASGAAALAADPRPAPRPTPVRELSPSLLLAIPPVAPCSAPAGSFACLRQTMLDPAYQVE